MNLQIDIGNYKINNESPVFVVAELSANHKQDLDLAIKTVLVMKESGADAIKVQTFLPETMTLDIDIPTFQVRKDTLWEGKSLFELYKEAYLPWEWHQKIADVARSCGLIFFSTPFDKTAVDFLEKMDVPAYKVASPEITDIQLIKYIASKGKPVILSTGIATLCDIEEAVNSVRSMGNDQIALLKCTTAYPAPFSEINLRTITNMKETFSVIPGLSDHTLGISVPIAAVALGAKIIEKHFILDNNTFGLDSQFSLNPTDFKSMVKAIREVEQALGTINYNLTEHTTKSKLSARSLFAIKNISEGEIITNENVKSIRPGYGLHPRFLPEILGMFAIRDIVAGSPIRLQDLKNNS